MGSMRRELFCLAVLAMALQSAHSQTAGPISKFNCLREGVVCYQGANCTTGGTSCDCPTDDPATVYTAPDCHYNSTSTCATPCGANGQCVLEDATATCACNEGYYGSACNIPRVYLQCYADGMYVVMNPDVGEGAFTGTITGGSTQCQFALITDADKTLIQDAGGPNSAELVGYFMNMDYAGTSCGTPVNATADNGDITNTFGVLVTFNSQFVTDKDEQWGLRCKQLASGSDTPVDTVIVPETVNFGLGGIDQTVAPVDLVPFEIDVKRSDGTAITTDVTLGELVTITYNLKGGSVYSKFLLVDVTASNGKAGDAAVSVPLVSGGCMAGKSNLITNLNSVSDTQIQATIKIFKFLTTAQYTLSSTLRACTAAAPDACNATACDGGVQGVGRRRRDVGDEEPSDDAGDDAEETNVKTLDWNIFIDLPPSWEYVAGNSQYINGKTYYNVPGTVNSGGSGGGYYGGGSIRPYGQYDSRYCAKSLTLLIVIIVLCVILLISLCCCAFFCIKSHQKGNRGRSPSKRGQDNHSYRA